MLNKEKIIRIPQNKVNQFAHRFVLSKINEAIKEGNDSIKIDFSRVQKAYPNGMIPLISSIDFYKKVGGRCAVTLPSTENVRGLFFSSNWAHLLLPDKFDPQKTAFYKHLAARRFHNFQEQQDIVNEFMDIVICNMTLKKDIISALEWSINEITDNVLNHSESPIGGLVQVSTYPQNHRISFAVADSGRGIKNSLSEAYPDIKSDILAIGEAVKSGVTRNNSVGQGNGLAGTLRIADQTGGSFSVASGKGKLDYYNGSANKKSFDSGFFFNGTIVCADIFDTASSFSIENALEFGGKQGRQTNIVEMNYLADDCTSFMFIMKNESSGFGNRTVGKMLRQKVSNILDTEKNIPIVINWEGIPIISSSFADEFIGKMFKEFGPLMFSARVRNIGMESIIHGLLDKAISQRLTQANDDFE